MLYRHFGFTGTQKGMTDPQADKLEEALSYLPKGRWIGHHGDCIGADQEFDGMLDVMCFDKIIHPPIDPKKRAFCKGPTILKPKPYLERNHDIVDAVEFMFAAPKEKLPKTRSGTWATIRYAEKLCKTLIMIYPDGTVIKEERW